MHVLFFISNKNEVQTVNHNYIYTILMLATCCSFCGKPLPGNKKYIKQDHNNTPPWTVTFSDS